MEKTEDTDLWCDDCKTWIAARIVWLSPYSFEIENLVDDTHEGHALDVR